MARLYRRMPGLAGAVPAAAAAAEERAMRETAADRRRPRESMLADTSTLELDICWKIQ